MGLQRTSNEIEAYEKLLVTMTMQDVHDNNDHWGVDAHDHKVVDNNDMAVVERERRMKGGMEEMESKLGKLLEGLDAVEEQNRHVLLASI